MTAETNNQTKPKVKDPQKPPPVAETAAPEFGTYTVGRTAAGSVAAPRPPNQTHLNPTASVFTSIVMRQVAAGEPLEMPGHKTARGLRETAVLQMQQRLGNASIQRSFPQKNNTSGVPTLRTNAEMIQSDWLDTAVGVATGIGRGIYSVGEDIVGGLTRTGRGLNVLDLTEQIRIAEENERAFNLLSDIVTNHDLIEELVTLTIEYLYNQLPEDRRTRVDAAIRRGAAVGVAHLVGRMIIGKQIATMLARRIAVYIASTQTFRALAVRLGVSAATGSTGIGIPITLLMLQGVLERAGQASRRLSSQSPELYRALRTYNLDMAWFLIEPHLDEIRQQLEERVNMIEQGVAGQHR